MAQNKINYMGYGHKYSGLLQETKHFTLEEKTTVEDP
jgi:hypothetical protein